MGKTAFKKIWSDMVCWGSYINQVKQVKKFGKIRVLRKDFCLSAAENDTSGPLNRGGIADLTLLRILLAIHQKAREPSFFEMIDSFVLLA